MQDENNENMLIPLELSTGSFNEMEAMLLVGYSGGAVVQHKKKSYMTLKSAIEWNKIEASQSGSTEKEYRELMVQELEKSLVTGEFKYTDEILEKWAIVFPAQAKALIKSKSKKISPELKMVVKSAVKT